MDVQINPNEKECGCGDGFKSTKYVSNISIGLEDAFKIYVFRVY